jgi:hypothetical protein
MEITKAGIAFVAAACVTAGAAGGYLVTRHEPTVAADSGSPAAAADAGAIPVERSEAVVDEPVPVTPRLQVPRPAPARAAATPSARPVVPARAPQPPAAPAAGTPDAHVIPVEAPPVLPIETRPVEVVAARPIEPVGPELEDLVLSADSVIGLQVETAVSSESARIEDPVVAVVVRDVKVGSQVAIPAGSKAHGEVTLVERGGRLRERARLGVRFTSIVLANGGGTVPISAEAIYREGDAPGRESTAKIGGGAIGGAILGGILGGAKGAAIGGSIGAGAGSAAVLAGGRNPAALSPGSPVTIRLDEAAVVTVER